MLISRRTFANPKIGFESRALGATVEFMTAGEIRQQYGSDAATRCFARMVGGILRRAERACPNARGEPNELNGRDGLMDHDNHWKTHLQKIRANATSLVEEHRQFRFEPYPGRASAYVVDTAQTVLHAFFATDSFESCLIHTVNLGGDADTTGAIAGMLAGAYYGVDAIPGRWLNRLDRMVRQTIENQATALPSLRARSN